MSRNSFGNYNHARGTFDQVVLGYTSRDDLNMYGFGPRSAPNIQVLNYLQVANRISPLLNGNLPFGLQQCFKAQDHCKAYVVKVSDISKKRYGNVVTDLTTFQRKTRTTGWKMEAMFVLVGDIVVYKSWDGTPEVEEYRKRLNPLGPFQEFSGFIG
ncbi:MAG: hypothetical protein OSB62_02925 [Alphaproteobacteria bacterium]|nr:hypothetical protein [Alphaproteobacteria bacterium]